ncbi:hypothetical protein RUM43_008448 [Polyplax serrata]|uniref:Arf-GAP domain-containing protein n=1 Tax=Polyplax serrata TaxID=468196 RepID=A0AAN8S0I9_POLSC
MASSRKKQDEKNLKILRNLVASPGNKQCFDCNQRGPTYVNVTIGSFVCTTCSGLLRGLTPPHRVKSISMTTFTSEEIESLRSKGNEYCRKVWLALYDSDSMHTTKDEHLVRDFMVAKYEKKLYYMEPSDVIKNGTSSAVSGQSVTRTGVENVKVHHSLSNSSPAASLSTNLKTLQSHMSTAVSHTTDSKIPDPFRTATSLPFFRNQMCDKKQMLQENQEVSFANFDNNPVFNSSNITASNPYPTLKPITTVEDKYAALKDLDCLMKMQQESPSDQGISGNGWSQSKLDKGASLNPFQLDIGNNNVVNPFRSGFSTQLNENSLNNNEGSMHNSGTHGTPGNSWGSNNWINTALPLNPSLNLSIKGNLSIIPGSSNNPFL